MYKIRKIEFIDHPILKNLRLDFCDENGNAVDTVLFAGENGTGKSTILNELYNIACRHSNADIILEVETNCEIRVLKTMRDGKFLWITDSMGLHTFIGSDDFKSSYNFEGIFSDVDINFHANDIRSVTSLNLDSDTQSRKSSNNLPQEVKQLLIDIQALDANAVLQAADSHPDVLAKDLPVDRRMPRFTNAFSRMFDNLEYSRIDNVNGHKEILFKKYGREIPIDQLSSGEKQVVYRGCFLLKDANALDGAFVFIDEPEISLHPTWQQKIMDYYKGIFTNAEGVQTSQIFAVTHSPFIIHNDNRRNDKVIVLTRDAEGNIAVKDKPEYFKCDSVEVVEDAFSVHEFGVEHPTVFLEGRTDEKYLKRAAEVFGLKLPFEFQWIGYIDKKGQEAHTGKDSLRKSAQFLIGRHLPFKNVFLYDCDTNHQNTEEDNVITRVLPTYANSKQMRAGIENALILDSIDVEPFYIKKVREGDYGNDTIIKEFKKMEFCDYICSLDNDALKDVFDNLRAVIEELIADFSGAACEV